MQPSEKKNRGRPLYWGDKVPRIRVTSKIAAEFTRIQSQFPDPEDGEQYILDCLNQSLKVHRVRLYDGRVSATPGVTASGGDDSYEEVEVPTMLVKNPSRSFLVRVAGDSMVDACIPDGSYILAKEMNSLHESPTNRAIVTAVVNDQILVKRYRFRYNKHELISENRKKNYPPISISSDMSEHEAVFIFGVYQRVIPESMINIVSF